MSDSRKCAYCGDPNFGRMNSNISDWCLRVDSIPLPTEGSINIDVYIQPPIEEEKLFCGFGCLNRWLREKI